MPVTLVYKKNKGKKQDDLAAKIQLIKGIRTGSLLSRSPLPSVCGALLLVSL